MKEKLLKIIKGKQFLISIFILILMNILGVYGRENLIYNYSPSIPKGFYKVIDKAPISYKKNDIVSFNIKHIKKIQETVKGNFDFLKIVAGVPGDKILIKENKLFINNKFKCFIQERNSENELLPKLSPKSFIIKKNEVFVLGTAFNSFDSRYFGAIETKNITCKAKPLWTF